jgi:putative Mg2+ transporter-C (MgtC) family protein
VLVTDIVNTPSLREVEIVLPTSNGSLASPDSGRGSAGVFFGMPSDWALAARILVGMTLAFIIGFERQLRGSPAGDRTFALVGLAATAVTAVMVRTSPQAIAGVVTGVGFIGAGVVFHAENTFVKGITTASAIFATAGLGIVVGSGHLLLGCVTAGALLLMLELRNIPALRRLDARRYADRFRNDNEPPKPGTTR